MKKLYERFESDPSTLTRKVGRVLFMTFEHEALHAETLLYMLLQRAGFPGGTIQPPGFATPPFEQLAESWNSAPQPSETSVTLGPATVVLGHDDPEGDDDTLTVVGHEFGWDNEHPRREVQIEKFRIEWRPVTNGEFHSFFQGAGHGKVKLPSSWVEGKEGAIAVCPFIHSTTKTSIWSL